MGLRIDEFDVWLHGNDPWMVLYTNKCILKQDWSNLLWYSMWWEELNDPTRFDIRWVWLNNYIHVPGGSSRDQTSSPSLVGGHLNNHHLKEGHDRRNCRVEDVCLHVWRVYEKGMVDTSSQCPQCRTSNRVHPRRIDMVHLRIHPWKRKIIFQTIIFRFYQVLS